MKNYKIRIAVLLIIAIALILVSCGDSTNSNTKVSVKEDPIKIGWIGPLSGDGASWGLDNLKGVEIAVDDINKVGGIKGRKVKLIVEDSKLDEKTALSAYKKMRSVDNIDVLLSADYGALLALVETADKTQEVIINSLDTSEELASAGEYLFAIGIHDENIGYRLASFAAKDLSKKKAVLFFNQDPITDLISSAFVSKFEDLGGEIVLKEGYVDSTHDFRTVLLKAKKSGADTLVAYGFDESGFIFKQEKELGLGFTKMGFDTVTSENFLTNAGSAAEDVYFTSWDATGKKYIQLEKKVVAKFTQAPDQPLFTAAGYDSVIFVGEAMKKGAISGEALHDELYKIQGLKGVSGTLSMSSDGIVRTVDEEMFQIQD